MLCLHGITAMKDWSLIMRNQQKDPENLNYQDHDQEGWTKNFPPRRQKRYGIQNANHVSQWNPRPVRTRRKEGHCWDNWCLVWVCGLAPQGWKVTVRALRGYLKGHSCFFKYIEDFSGDKLSHLQFQILQRRALIWIGIWEEKMKIQYWDFQEDLGEANTGVLCQLCCKPNFILKWICGI